MRQLIPVKFDILTTCLIDSGHDHAKQTQTLALLPKNLAYKKHTLGHYVPPILLSRLGAVPGIHPI